MARQKQYESVWEPVPPKRWRVTARLDLLVAADTDRAALEMAMQAMRNAERYAVEQMEVAS